MLGELKKVAEVNQADTFSTVELLRCNECTDTHLLSIRTTTVKVDKEGKASTTDRFVVKNLLIDEECNALIQDIHADARLEASEDDKPDVEA